MTQQVVIDEIRRLRDALAAAEAERDDYRQAHHLVVQRVKAAEAEVARLRECVQELEDNRESETRELQLHDEVARLREALREIAEPLVPSTDRRDIARAALADKEGT